MNNTRKSLYLGEKYFLDDIKKDKLNIMKCKDLLKSYSINNDGKYIYEKVYYDTPDFFFYNRGICVNVNTNKTTKTSALVVRYLTNIRRINFLNDIPDTFEIQIPFKSNVYNYAQFFADAVKELIPYGLSVDVMQTFYACRPVVVVEKKIESYTAINITGLKFNLKYSKTMFSTPLIAKRKNEYLILEVECRQTDRQKEFDQFIKSLSFHFPKLVKTDNSDLVFGKNNLFE